MNLKGKKIGFILTGSFCTFNKIIEQMKNIKKQEAEIIPIMSYNSYNFDTKFGKSKDFINQITEICQRDIIHTIQDSEPIRSKKTNRYNANCSLFSEILLQSLL